MQIPQYHQQFLCTRSETHLCWVTLQHSLELVENNLGDQDCKGSVISSCVNLNKTSLKWMEQLKNSKEEGIDHFLCSLLPRNLLLPRKLRSLYSGQSSSDCIVPNRRDRHDSQQSLVSRILGNACGSSDDMATGSSCTVIYIAELYHYRNGSNSVRHLGCDCGGRWYRHLNLKSWFHSPCSGSCLHLHLLVLLQWPHRPSQHLPLHERSNQVHQGYI